MYQHIVEWLRSTWGQLAMGSDTLTTQSRGTIKSKFSDKLRDIYLFNYKLLVSTTLVMPAYM